ncbi:hypothetical protein GSI_09281 [Ganoderma sinense ZZ0214-1]|uniref:Uncharacterized protein n=1 Tax=Ganoderma sinense ZZ0214-1 TaxID=1077348 RepID=A0A2G8S630_9APHY|nr:hypothetical protein GSI_09281 [Ganoderma sinense ZZ0214-1]
MPQLHPVLPIELFEEIIGHTSDNTVSLQHISLTCHAFLPRARYHLFTSIRIHTVQQLDSSGEFLDSHPWLTPLIRCVAFCVLTAAPGSLSAPADRASRLLDVVPVHLLSRLPNIYIWRVGAEGYSPRGQAPSQLSLHRFAPSCYRKYGISITNLELSNVRFDGISDFARLVSAFASIQSLSASFIFFRKAGEDDESSLLSDFTEETTMPRAGRSLFIKRLQIGVHKDIRVVGYLLLASATTANTLNLTIRDGGPWHEHDNYISEIPLIDWKS